VTLRSKSGHVARVAKEADPFPSFQAAFADIEPKNRPAYRTAFEGLEPFPLHGSASGNTRENQPHSVE
jgi:hypothetical protein